MEHPRPERIDASPEEIAEVVLRAKPKKVWRFEQEREKGARADIVSKQSAS